MCFNVYLNCLFFTCCNRELNQPTHLTAQSTLMLVSSTPSVTLVAHQRVRHVPPRVGEVQSRCVSRPRAARNGDVSVRGSSDDESRATSSTSSSDDDANERLRETLRAAMGSEEGGGTDCDETGTTDDSKQSKDPSGDSGKRYRITVRDWTLFQYTLPNFFPDFNETPVEARRNAGTWNGLDSMSNVSWNKNDDTVDGKKTKQPYVWKRGVLAGTERSDPLDVIALQREKLEEELRGKEMIGDEKNRSSTDGTTTTSAASTGNEARRPIPRPPGYVEETEMGFVSKTLMGATLFFYVIALFVASSRAFLGDGEPAPFATPGIDTPGLATEIALTPESIKGTKAGEIWKDALGTGSR